MDPATFVVAEQAVSTTVEGAALAGYGLAQSTQPLNATFTRITSEAFLPRSSHTITVVAGKAYIFGGDESPGKLADDNVHIIKLPAKKPTNVGESEYKCVPSLGDAEDGKGEVPGARAGHTACAIGHRIYIFGGKGQDGKPIEENGTLWVFDTETLRWTGLKVSGDNPFPYPPARYNHSAVASEYPLPPSAIVPDTASYTEQIKSTVAKIPAMIGKGSPPREPHGSIIVCGGLSSSSSGPLTDVWTFTVAGNTWSALPTLPAIPSPTLAYANHNLFALGGSDDDVGSEIHRLQLHKDSQNIPDRNIRTEQTEWLTLPFPTNPLAPGPRPRKGAGMLPATTGNGRLYILYFLGEKVSKAEKTEDISEKTEDIEYWSDTWSYQIPAVDIAPAGIKDKTRSLMGISTGEGTWAEVKVVPNEEGSGGLETEGKSHPGPRGWFASCALGKEIDGGGVVLWGGINAKGETEGEGWIVSVK
ncbi:MAG: hypothetical protein L6R40_007013 [Gallowayella cf. fulva]|nr:MAG: hypothetical protein L6R40_007013 [Xanthomendoza cf. fulva]